MFDSDTGTMRGQSETTGVVLVVALAVVLGGVIGFFAFDTFEGETSTTPAVTFEHDYDAGANELTIRHRSGDAFEMGNAELLRSSGSGTTLSWTPTTGEIGASDTITVTGVQGDDTIELRWTEPGEDGKTVVLAEWEGPDAG